MYISTLEDAGLEDGKHFRVNLSELTVLHNWGARHLTYFRSAEKPRKIRKGYNCSHGWGDETADWPEESLQAFQSRIRCPNAEILQTFHSTTPEGVNHLFERFHPDKMTASADGKFEENETQLVLHGSSYDNKKLPKAYLDQLEAEFEWDQALFKNYVLGQWVSLAKDRFYFSFDEKQSVIECKPQQYLPTLYVTFDNNVGRMAWVAIQSPGVDHNGLPLWYCVKSNKSDGRNIDHACNQFLDAFPEKDWKAHRLVVLGDAVLHHRSLHSYVSGYDLIKEKLQPHFASVEIKAHRQNPLVEERSYCTNRAFSTGRLKIDRDCSKLILSARTAEIDPRNPKGIKKPADDDITHPMEAVDMALMVLEPRRIQRRGGGFDVYGG